MATMKIQFRPSVVDGGLGVIYYQIIHNGKSCLYKTEYHLYPDEWDCDRSEVVLSGRSEFRIHYLLKINCNIKLDIERFNRIIGLMERDKPDFASDDVISVLFPKNPESYLFLFMRNVIAGLKDIGKIRTSETYTSALNSFRKFRNNEDIAFDDIDSDVMIAYEAYLKACGVSPNSSSFYIRNLRAVYNRAVEKGLTSQRFPFKHVYTGIEKTTKRAVSLKIIKQIKDMDLSHNPASDFARDMFLFSFYTRGMSFVDMAYLQKKNLNSGVLSYRRRKTGQQLYVKWERCMQEIVDKYDTSGTDYLLPILNTNNLLQARKQYIYALHKVNRYLKKIGEIFNLSIVLTLYVARHSWATIARSKNVPVSVISEAMGHDSETTTRIYLASLDTNAVDNANSLILESL
ncbi:MAG: site-specific integrase [Bacteroidales bacterium]|nr:site-specific integrase [Bacteroidales bacterium]